jgi:hypothetical protein
MYMNRDAIPAGELWPGYFWRLLSQISWRTDLRIDMYRRGLAYATERGDVGYACAFRHLTRIDEEDRQVLQLLIASLQRRFPQSDETVPLIFRSAWVGFGGTAENA